jgi:hypothetical protein
MRYRMNEWSQFERRKMTLLILPEAQVAADDKENSLLIDPRLL